MEIAAFSKVSVFNLTLESFQDKDEAQSASELQFKLTTFSKHSLLNVDSISFASGEFKKIAII